jgi:hypothetical protein
MDWWHAEVSGFDFEKSVISDVKYALILRETEGTVDQFIADRREQAKREDTN